VARPAEAEAPVDAAAVERGRRGPLFTVRTWSALILIAWCVLVPPILVLEHHRRRAELWPTVEGEILVSQVTDYLVVGKDGRMRTRSRVDFSYRYEVGGVAHVGDRMSFWPERPQDWQEAFPKGKRVPVYYDPENPETAVVRPVPDTEWEVMEYFLLGFLTLLAIAGAWAIRLNERLAVLRGRRPLPGS
jgi:hypothetical protein